MSKHSPDADVAFISALAELLNKNELTELSVKREYGEDDSLEVRVVKQVTVVQAPPTKRDSSPALSKVPPRKPISSNLPPLKAKRPKGPPGAAPRKRPRGYS